MYGKGVHDVICDNEPGNGSQPNPSTVPVGKIETFFLDLEN